MPIYEYRCERCEEEFEVSQRITADALTEHEECGGEVKRLISRTSFSLKGAGWYSDHYGLQPGASKKDSGSSGGNGAVAPESKSDSKSETKSEAKSESKGTIEKASKPEKKEKPASSGTSGKSA